jgi:hypothetical protein
MCLPSAHAIGGIGSNHGGYSELDEPTDLSTAINSTWMCVRWMVVGPCYPPPLLAVTHYWPVAYITTPVKRDVTSGSLLSSAGTSALDSHTRIKKDSLNRAMAWDAIVWQITSTERTVALASWSGCLCDQVDPSSGSSGTAAEIGVCDRYEDDMTTAGQHKMWYNSARDGNNWRKGCRDMTSVTAQASSSTYSLVGCSSVPGLSSFMNESCLGSWGPLYPRYTFTAGTTEIISSMKIAYRAAHVASKTLFKMPHLVDKTGIMQQVDPAPSAICFDIGQSPLLVDLLSRVSTDGQYSWIYWKRVGCCKSISACG